MRNVKIFTLIFMCSLTIFLISCKTTEKMDNDAYAEKYYEVFLELETLLDQEYYHAIIDMLNVQEFEFVYINEDFTRCYDDLIKKVDETLYELSIIGPKIDDEFIQKQQSIIEYTLLDYMNVLKVFRERESFNVLVPVQFALYNDMYEIFNEINPITLKLNTARYEIEAYFKNNNIEGLENYYEVKQKNMYRENYLYLVLGAHVSTYQEYSGLQVYPDASNYITLGKRDQYRVAELGIGLMNPLVNNIKSQMELLNKNETTFNISQKVSEMSSTFTKYLNAYTGYFEIRVMYSHDFFKKDHFRDYMKLISTSEIKPNWWAEIELIKYFDFDPIYEETHHLIEMTENYLFLSNLIKFEDHKTNMFID